MTVVITLGTGEKMFFPDQKLSDVLRQCTNSGIVVRLVGLSFHPRNLEKDLTELASDIPVTYSQVAL